MLLYALRIMNSSNIWYFIRFYNPVIPSGLFAGHFICGFWKPLDSSNALLICVTDVKDRADGLISAIL